jgi:ribosome-associated protein
MDNTIVNDQLPNLETAPALEIAKALVHVLDMKKGREIKLLHIADHTIIADYFVICGGTSNTNVRALAGEAEYKLSQAGVPALRMDGYTEGEWIAVDFGCVIVHIFNRETRMFYDLEKLWSDSTEVNIDELLTEK